MSEYETEEFESRSQRVKDTIKRGVLELLREDERCRNDDKWLVWKYLREKAGIQIFIPFEDFKKMPAFESIRRVRQHIQNDLKLFLPTDPEVRIARRIEEEEWKIWLQKAKNFGVEY
jgi:hypothetical protein